MSVTSKVAHELNDADKLILDELAEGRNLSQNLANELGYSRQYIHNRLQMLKAADYVKNVGGGLYELVDDPRGGDVGERQDELDQLRDRIVELEERIDEAFEAAEATVEAIENVNGDDAHERAKEVVTALKEEVDE
ncbi:Winged helix-turn-helix DNA-binding [Halopenitus malekzadehii]|uniref:Winged helix-turn-helix DNA-binding n=1 Tax=Halopenitus malekzadehii TaxID=1267564 RepID=A0A1H6JF55_9EURY|nr:winged helix-turn-helix transcriptional regulator [Halopenitus malekzadehii]SEH60890.1 Winged helix-turn-helix DNA-binding [Halopenitus malekzadehii]